MPVNMYRYLQYSAFSVSLLVHLAPCGALDWQKIPPRFLTEFRASVFFCSLQLIPQYCLSLLLLQQICG